MASILIVDDQADNPARADPARAAGRARHGRPGGAGRRRLTHLARHVPDLILLDVMMPDVDGFDVLRAVRADPRTARVPVVMFSAVSAEEMIERARAEGANDYWIKGAIGAESLCAGIAEHLAATGRALATNGWNSVAPA